MNPELNDLTELQHFGVKGIERKLAERHQAKLKAE